MKNKLQTLLERSAKKLMLGSMLAIGSALTAQTTVMDVIDNSPIHTTLKAAIDATNLRAGLSNPNSNLTIFAPTDAAFDALPAGTVDAFLGSPEGIFELRQILRYHVLSSEVLSTDIMTGSYVQTLAADSIITTVTSTSDVFINHSPVTSGAVDLQTDNGVVHSLDHVLLPGNTLVDLAIQAGFTTLATAVVAADLVPALVDPASDLTVFAPTNEAFAAIQPAVDDLLAGDVANLQAVLLYHVIGANVPSTALSNGLFATTLEGDSVIATITGAGDVFINQAPVIATDVAADNGIVHAIDAVILPQYTLIDLVIDFGFTTLTNAVVAAELVPALVDPASDLTVFAPIDEAFEALDPTLLSDLLADPTGDLRDILLFHVLGTNVLSTSITDGMVSPTLLGSDDVTFTLVDQSIFIQESRIIATDAEVDNGIAHAIDAVMIPTFLTTGLFNNASQNAALSVYPNPVANSNLFVETAGNASYLIMDARGSVVSEGTYNASGINVSNLSEGVYSIQVVSDSKTYSSTFVK